MGLILCDNTAAIRPYYISELGVHLYSAEELCYVIHENPLLVLDGFVNESLLEFIKSELGMGMVALQLEKMHSEGVPDEDVLYMILEECDYYTTAEISKFRQTVQSLRTLPDAEYLKLKADYLYNLNLYGRAITCYLSILKLTSNKTVTDAFTSDIYYNLGSSYAGMFQLDKAYAAYDKAYSLKKDISILKMIYYISLMEPVLELKERYQSILGDQVDKSWDEEYEACMNDISNSDSMKQLEDIRGKDAIRKKTMATDMVREWKSEFRNMN